MCFTVMFLMTGHHAEVPLLTQLYTFQQCNLNSVIHVNEFYFVGGLDYCKSKRDCTNIHFNTENE